MTLPRSSKNLRFTNIKFYALDEYTLFQDHRLGMSKKTMLAFFSISSKPFIMWWVVKRFLLSISLKSRLLMIEVVLTKANRPTGMGQREDNWPRRFYWLVVVATCDSWVICDEMHLRIRGNCLINEYIVIVSCYSVYAYTDQVTQ